MGKDPFFEDYLAAQEMEETEEEEGRGSHNESFNGFGHNNRFGGRRKVITFFLCSPPRDMRLCHQRLLAIMRRLVHPPINAEVQIIAHPNAYSLEMLRAIHIDASEEETDYFRSLNLSPQTLPSEDDIERLSEVFGQNFRTFLNNRNIVSSVTIGPMDYTSSHVVTKADVYRSWQRCYQDQGINFPTLFWNCEW